MVLVPPFEPSVARMNARFYPFLAAKFPSAAGHRLRFKPSSTPEHRTSGRRLVQGRWMPGPTRSGLAVRASSHPSRQIGFFFTSETRGGLRQRSGGAPDRCDAAARGHYFGLSEDELRGVSDAGKCRELDGLPGRQLEISSQCNCRRLQGSSRPFVSTCRTWCGIENLYRQNAIGTPIRNMCTRMP